MDCTYAALYSTFTLPQSALQWPPIHPFTHTLVHQWVAAAMPGAASPVGSNLRFSVLPKDTGTDWDGMGFYAFIGGIKKKTLKGPHV